MKMVIIINFYTLQPVSSEDSLRNVRNIGSDDRTIYPVFRQTSMAEFATCKFNLSHLVVQPFFYYIHYYQRCQLVMKKSRNFSQKINLNYIEWIY